MQVSGVGLGAISVALPSRIVTNKDMAQNHPDWRMELVESKTGVYQRHIADAHETALDLAEAACRDLVSTNEGLLECVDGIIFCTQTPDFIMPPNACLLHDRLELGDGVMAFDTSLACSGYVYSLAIAKGLIVSGMCTNILVVTADTYSKLINPADRSATSLFGDGAAATWVSARADAVIIDAICETSGSGYRNFYIPAGGTRQPSTPESSNALTDASGNQRSANDIHMNGMGVLAFANTKVPDQVRRLLWRNEVAIEDIDLVVFHQASKLAVDSLILQMGFCEHQVARNLSSVGNTVSASIPMALSQALVDGRAVPGDLVLLCGFGVGLSWASMLVRL